MGLKILQVKLSVNLYFAGKNRRTSTKEESLTKAKEIAEDWYLQLRGKLRAGEIKSEKTFREVSEHYLHEYDIITQGQRNKQYVNGRHWRSSLHLVPFLGNLGISALNEVLASPWDARAKKNPAEHHRTLAGRSFHLSIAQGSSGCRRMIAV
jgi:hypothetical protein